MPLCDRSGVHVVHVLLVGRKTAPLLAYLHRLQRRPDRIERRAAARPALPAAREKLRPNRAAESAPD